MWTSAKGMGYSGAAPDGAYRFVDHQRYLDTWFDALGIARNVILVLHDWGSALGFSWAHRHPDRSKPIEGRPPEVVQIVDAYAKWLSTSPIPKLFINGDPPGFLIGVQREFCRTWPNQQEVSVSFARGPSMLETCPAPSEPTAR